MSALTLHTLFTNNALGIDTHTHIVVSLDYIILKKNRSNDINKPETMKSNFLVGIEKIKQELNRTISNLQAIEVINTENVSQISYPFNNKCVHKKRVFVLGIMKTGTTSMTAALDQLGYHCGKTSCIHLGNWFTFIDSVHLWQPLEVIILSILNMTDLFSKYLLQANNALSFGDSPWCFLWPVFDKIYPNSKYILMTRTNDEIYINSYLTYLKTHKKQYVTKGLTDETFALIALRRYHLHNERVRNYFKNRPDDLLEIVVGKTRNSSTYNEWNEITTFLGCNKPSKPFPHQNKGIKKHINIQINISDNKWNWREIFGDDIVYVTQDSNKSHSVHVMSKDKFVLDWNLFLVDELKSNKSHMYHMTKQL